jgi:hypothetical protein
MSWVSVVGWVSAVRERRRLRCSSRMMLPRVVE